MGNLIIARVFKKPGHLDFYEAIKAAYLSIRNKDLMRIFQSGKNIEKE